MNTDWESRYYSFQKMGVRPLIIHLKRTKSDLAKTVAIRTKPMPNDTRRA